MEYHFTLWGNGKHLAVVYGPNLERLKQAVGKIMIRHGGWVGVDIDPLEGSLDEARQHAQVALNSVQTQCASRHVLTAEEALHAFNYELLDPLRAIQKTAADIIAEAVRLDERVHDGRAYFTPESCKAIQQRLADTLKELRVLRAWVDGKPPLFA